jgi:hypothetical protein
MLILVKDQLVTLITIEYAYESNHPPLRRDLAYRKPRPRIVPA